MEAAGGPELRGEQAGPPPRCRPASQVHVPPAPSLLWNVHTTPPKPHHTRGPGSGFHIPALHRIIGMPHPAHAEDVANWKGHPGGSGAVGLCPPGGLPLSLPPLPPPLLLLWARGACRAAEQGASQVRRAPWREETPAGSSEAEQDSRGPRPGRRTGLPAAPLLLGPLNGPFPLACC